MKMKEVDIPLYLISHGCGNDKFRGKAFIEACESGKLKVAVELVEQHKVDPKGIAIHLSKDSN